jgi:cytochrome c
MVYNDQQAFVSTSKNHEVQLATIYAAHEKDVKAVIGIEEVAAISGQDIYNGRCIACHKFDTKLVGPPYNSVLPKYDGKQDQLIKFILNPVKVNPEYPAMPNQGLKPNEAEAIAEYIMKMYKEGK